MPTKTVYDVAAPAKLNLFLHIVGQRSDGYHLLESAFMLIDWCDVLHFELRRDGKISRQDNQHLPADDLCTQAARALQQYSQTPLGVHIELEKNIPSEAGLGGGSSDAASVLLVLNHLWKLRLPQAKLLQLGAQLGADVPFFLGGHNAWVQGIGEQLTPIVLPQRNFIVLKPQGGLSTTGVFRHPDLCRTRKRAIMRDFAKSPFAFGENALQTVAVMLAPQIQQALGYLQAHDLAPRMTGSGSAVFATGTIAKLKAAQAQADGLVKVCANLQEHPLVEWLVP